MALEIDNFTIVLLVVLVVLALYHRFYAPAPLVHPLLLGRQAEVSPVRQPGESGIYRSWATGQGTPLQVRPAGQLKTVGDAVKVPPSTPLPGKPRIPISQRWILDTPLTNEALTEVVRLVPLGIGKLFPELSGSILTLLPPSPTTALPLLLLSLASRPKHSLVILPSPHLLRTALTSASHPTPGLLVIHESVVDGLAVEALGRASVLIVGDPNQEHKAFAERAAKSGIAVKWWEQIWDAGETATDVPDTTVFSDVHSYFYAEDGTVAKVTHMNMTAGIAGLLSLFPADKRPTAADVVGSSIRLDTPFGMTVALASVYTGAGFRLIGPGVATWDAPRVPAGELGLLATTLDQPLPSVLILSPAHHSAIIKRLHDGFLASPLASVAARHRLQSLQAGHVSRGGLMDSLVWGGIRNTALGGIAGDQLRAIVVVGAPSPTDVALSHALLSLPLTRLHTTFHSTGPVFVSHFYDLQGPPVDMFKRKLDTDTAHSGPPAANVEVVLKGPKVDEADKPENAGKPFEGRVWIRGPSVIEQVGTKVVEGWVETKDNAAVFTNGCFVVRT